MPAHAVAQSPVIPKTYAELRRAVEVVMIQGQRAVELAKVRTYHETGRLIREHVLLNRERADYGMKTILHLSRDLQVDRSVLQRCDQFYRAFPICADRHKLAWAHYRLLLPIADDRQRLALADEANRRGWTSTELEERIRPLRLASGGPPAPGDGEPQPLLTPMRGAPGVSRIISVEGEALTVDLGFASYFDLPGDSGSALGAGALVEVDGNGRIAPAEGAKKSDLFNYRVELLRVVDGDTLWVKIYLRPRQWVKQKLRLRGLDCPEMSTPEGQAAKRFVDALFADTKSIVINTTKPDKYDRYLADVFLTTSKGEIFLNNELLANGHAVRKEKWEFGDWEKDLLA